jgi:phosphoribosyl-AMP cyclohydrolase
MFKNVNGTMIDYNAKNQSYVDRIKKELWSKGEMTELQEKLMNTKIA